jgi:hypothetical protein
VKGFQRRAWWLLFAIAAMIAMFGATDVAVGPAADPEIALGVSGRTHAELLAESADGFRMYDFTTRTQAWVLLTLGLLMLVIVAGPYRRGERWAWWAMWLLPIWAWSVPATYLVYGLAHGAALPPPVISGSIIGAISALVLLADRRRFERAA